MAQLNEQIMLAEGPGDSANDLRDRRDILLQDIASMASIDIVDRGDGTVDVVMAGRSVVVRDAAQELEMITDDKGELQLASGVRGFVLELQGGSIAGKLQALEKDVRGTITKLDDFAAEMIERVNALHTQGRTAGGSGLQFSRQRAADMAVTPARGDPSLLATSRSGLSGDADLAREIAALGRRCALGGDRPGAVGDVRGAGDRRGRQDLVHAHGGRRAAGARGHPRQPAGEPARRQPGRRSRQHGPVSERLRRFGPSDLSRSGYVRRRLANALGGTMVLRVTEGQIANLIYLGTQRSLGAMTNLQLQTTSGMRINSYADDPAGVGSCGITSR